MSLYNGLRYMDYVTIDNKEDVYMVIDIYDMNKMGYCKLQNINTLEIIDCKCWECNKK